MSQLLHATRTKTEGRNLHEKHFYWLKAHAYACTYGVHQRLLIYVYSQISCLPLICIIVRLYSKLQTLQHHREARRNVRQKYKFPEHVQF